MAATAKETVNVPKGVDSGINLRVSRKGHFSLTGPPGDLIIKLNVKTHTYFKKDGTNMHTDTFLTVT